jgi:hypothetical protein
MVFEIVERKASIIDEDILKELRARKKDLSFRELNGILLKLEIEGLVHVSRQSKGRRLVETVKTPSQRTSR